MVPTTLGDSGRPVSQPARKCNTVSKGVPRKSAFTSAEFSDILNPRNLELTSSLPTDAQELGRVGGYCAAVTAGCDYRSPAVSSGTGSVLVRKYSLICSTAFLVATALSAVWLISATRCTPSERKAVGSAALGGRRFLSSPYIVEVVGRDFVWSFRSPGEDGRLHTPDDVLTERQLSVPANADVELWLTSRDFIYTFQVPELALSQIAVPEMTHRLAFRTDVVGTYQIQADPMCGFRFFHDEVMARMLVRPPDEFVTPTGQPPASPQSSGSPPFARQSNDRL